MLFNSFEFLVFLILVFTGYWFIFYKNYRIQNIFIFITSYIFYGWWDWRFLFLISFSALVGFFSGIGMERSSNDKTRKALLTISLIINLIFLGVFKYFNFFSDSFEELLLGLGFKADLITLNWILPIGISFYTFHNISYIMDVYRKHIPPTKDVFIYLSFMSYFPQLVAGPIQRAKDLIPQFQKARTFNQEQAVNGLQQILWGLFKKVVIADNCSIIVEHAFKNYQSLSSIELVMGVVYFAFQIYGDFSGYTDMALGISKLFGIELTTNFKTPYFARTIPEFWRRWHISLTTWFKDYLYIPLGGNRHGLALTIRNTMIIFLVSGFWHGANWTYLVWGLLNAIYFLPYLFIQIDVPKDSYSRLRDIPAILIVFILICISWIFFRAANMHEAWGYMTHIATNHFLPSRLHYVVPTGLTSVVFFFLIVEWIFFRKDGFEPVEFKSRYLSWSIYAVIVLIIIMNISFYQSSDFIYFQF